MATIKVFLRKKKKNRQDEIPIYLRIIKDRKTQLVSLGYSIQEKHWDLKTLKVKKSHPNYQRLNEFIAGKVAEAEKVALQLEGKSMTSQPIQIKERLFGKDPELFSVYLDKYIEDLKYDNKYGTVGKATTLKTKLSTFTNYQVLHFTDITVDFLKRFERHLAVEYGNSHNTIYTSIKLIRKLFNDAIREGLITLASSPFSIYKFTWKSVKKCFLTEDELAKIEVLDLPENTRIWDCRNLFVFAVYAAGLRISDVLQLKRIDYDSERILVRTQKTGQITSILLPDKARGILNLYLKRGDIRNEFIFPFLDSTKHTSIEAKKFHKAISCYNAFINAKLKLIAIKAEINKNVSFHTSRHTFATLGLKKGIRLEYLSQLMAHASIKTTKVYAQIVNTELENAMKVFNE